MPDISMCANDSCPSRNECYRFRAIPNEHRQSYQQYSPKEGEDRCDDFSYVDGRKNLRKIKNMSLDVYLIESEEEVYWANITHNLNKMAIEAGIYKHLWSPDELNIKKAIDLVKPLKKGLDDLNNRPDHFRKFNSPNGWGMYKHFVPFVENYINACLDNPGALIKISK